MKLLYRNQITINKQLREVWVYEMRKKHSSARLKDDKIIIRLSSKISRRLQQEHAQNLLERLVKSLQKQPPKITKIWQDGEIIEAGDKKYLLHLQEKKQKTVTGKLIAPQAIKVNIPSNLSSKTKNQYIFKLIRQILIKDQQIWLENLSSVLNQKHFNYKYRQITWKNFQSKWGHCTYKNEIVICSRLLFMPRKVLEYVIIHELAHVKEKNHSKKFWGLVQNACPKYKEHKKILKNWQI